MELVGIRVALAPARTATLLGFVLGGITLGTISGLTPGIHANTFALLLAGVAPAVPAPVEFVGVAMLAAGTVHTFLDVVPALALGVPDAAMAATALPGHRLVIQGRGREALRLSALGSGGAVALAVPLSVPVTAAMTRAYPAISAHLPLLLAAVVVFLIVTERDWRGRVGATLSVAASGALGLATLDLRVGGVVDAGGMLAPLFAGLFGAPVLFDALDGGGVPPQGDAAVTTARRTLAGYVLAGTVAGALVGYLPGVSSAIAATVALLAVPAGGARGFVVATSGVNTANTIFALFAFVTLGTPRTGVLVALDSVGAAGALPVMLASVGFAAVAGFVLVLLVGDRYLRAVGRVDYRWLSLGVLGGLVCVVAVLAGPVGVGVFALAAVVGHLPPRFGTRRAALMGVLLVPIALGV
jgi:putative membrane protein